MKLVCAVHGIQKLPVPLVSCSTVQGLGFRVKCLCVRFLGLGVRVWDLGFEVQGLGLRASGFSV